MAPSPCISSYCAGTWTLFSGDSLHLFPLETPHATLSPWGSGWAEPTSYFQGWVYEPG